MGCQQRQQGLLALLQVHHRRPQHMLVDLHAANPGLGLEFFGQGVGQVWLLVELAVVKLQLHRADGVAFQQLIPPRDQHQFAAPDDGDRVADPLDIRQDVAGEHHRHLAAQPGDQVQHFIAPGRVEGAGGLVQQQHRRVVHQGLGDPQPLDHPARKAANPAPGGLLQPNQVQHGPNPLAGFIGCQVKEPGAVVQVFQGCHPVVKGRALRQIAEHPAGVAVGSGGFHPADPGPPGAGVGQPGQHAHGGGFAGPVAAQKAENGTVRYVQVEGLHRLDAAVIAGQVFAANGRLLGGAVLRKGVWPNCGRLHVILPCGPKSGK